MLALSIPVDEPISAINLAAEATEIPQCSSLPHPTRTFGGRAKPIPSPLLEGQDHALGPCYCPPSTGLPCHGSGR